MSSCGPICGLVTAVITLVVGISLLSYQSSLQSEADSMDPTSDFIDLGLVCTPTQSYWSSRDSENNCKKKNGRRTCDYTCYDIWSYDFTYSSKTYRSRSLEVSRGTGSGRCSSTTKGSEPFIVGLPTNCWKPVGSVPSGYTCGNPDCVKIWDPEDDASLAATTALVVLIISIIVLIYACMCGLGSGFAYQNQRRTTIIHVPATQGVNVGQPQPVMQGQPVYGQPMMGQPQQYGQPGTGQPVMGQPMMQTAYGQPQPMMQTAYGQPQPMMQGEGQPMMMQGQGQPMMQGQGQPMMQGQGQPMMQGEGQPMQGQGQPMMGQPQQYGQPMVGQPPQYGTTGQPVNGQMDQPPPQY